MKAIVSIFGALIVLILVLIYLTIRPPAEDASANAQRILDEMAMYP